MGYNNNSPNHQRQAGLAAERRKRMPAQFILEPERRVDLQPHADVIVCGGGPAGVAAAVAAARTGARTRLFELGGCLGGVWTAGLLTIVLDAAGPRAFLSEITRALEDLGGPLGHFQAKDYGRMADFYYDPEDMKIVLERLCLRAGVEIQYHTRVCAAVVEGGRLRAVITESKSGRQAWPAAAFVDATGDGDLAARAGCAFAYGRADEQAQTLSPEEMAARQAQPLSMVALVTGLDPAEVARFTNGHPDYSDMQTKQGLAEEIRRGGVDPSYHLPVLLHIRGQLFSLAANHQYGVSGLDAAQVTRATLEAREEVQRVTRALRGLGGPWRNLALVATPAQIGVRDGRRIAGRYTLTVADLLAGREQPDAVCRVNFPVDVHATDPARGKGYTSEGVRSKPYDIPLRALLPAGVDGLLTAGRCISGDFLAHASYRVTGNAVSMGTAAGAAAGLAALSGRLPHEVPFAEIAARL
jgi:hypothetical protein